MNWILKNKKTSSEKLVDSDCVAGKIASQKRKTKALWVVLFLVFGFFFKFPGFLKLSIALAAETTCVISTQCLDPAFPKCDLVKGVCTTAAVAAASNVAPAAAANAGTPPAVKTVQDGATSVFVNAIKELLMGVFTICGWIFAIAATLFSWVIEPANVSGANGMLNKQAVKDVWIMVRDMLNMTFILILLFAAFCTIFRVEKWNLKKVWLNILINALLVNFSYPIARFFIDVSNVAFYYFVNNLFSSTGTINGSSIFANLGEVSKFGSILQPAQYAKADISYIVAMIVLTFILGMTLMVIAGLFVVRLVALTMLVMFSPVGFVGYIFPATSSYADKWWKQLFSYSFFAPIMIFVMAIALRIMEVMGDENFNSMLSNSSANTTNQSTWIANVAFFIIPDLVLWMGMGVAKSLGIEGADKVVDGVKKGGKWLANAPGHYSGAYGGTKKGWESARKDGKVFGMQNWATKLAFQSGVEGREGKLAAFLSGGKSGLKKYNTNKNETGNKEDIEKGAKAHIDSGKTADEMATIVNKAHPTVRKEIIEHAQAATAYQRMDSEEKRSHLISTLSGPAGNYGDFQEMLNGTAHPSLTPAQVLKFTADQNIAKAAANNIKLGTARKKDHQDLAAFVNKQMKAKIALGVKA